MQAQKGDPQGQHLIMSAFGCDRHLLIAN